LAPSVSTNATAVAASTARTIAVDRTRATRRRFYAAGQ
jgi:conjugal transfer/entry exclusion protein